MQPLSEVDVPASGRPAFDEVTEFFTTLLATPAHRVTACRGWTAHELVAHLVAGAAEEADLIEAHLAQGPARPTRGHEERELPYRAIPDLELRDQLIANSARLTQALHLLADRGPTEGVLFTGRPMTAADFAMHSRSECALHRWDLIGRDDKGWEMLSNPALTEHAVAVLSAMSSLPEAPANRLARHRVPGDTRVVLRSPRHEDVVIATRQGVIEMRLEPSAETAPDLVLDPAARLLLLWGRREPSAPIDLFAHEEHPGVIGLLLER